MFNLPELLKYPKILPVNERPEIQGLYCYIVEDYSPGYSMLVKRSGEDVGFKFGNWDGVVIQDVSKQMLEVAAKVMQLMIATGIGQVQYYFSNEGLLVDAQLSLNKMMGPGMLRDIFHSNVPTQKYRAIETMTPDKIEHYGSLGKSILKPSRQRFVQQGDVIAPLYATLS